MSEEVRPLTNLRLRTPRAAAVAGVVGLLLEAKSQSAVDALRPHLDALRHKAGFYFTDQVYHSALTLAGESDK